jgi:hypothetical protein
LALPKFPCFFSFRVCETNEDESETTAISRSSDICLSFDDIDHTWAFLQGLIHSSNEYYTKFKVYFVTLQQVTVENNEQPFDLPLSASSKKYYALKMLYSMGYVFQDKYLNQVHDQLITFGEELFINRCYYLKDKLEENHCYNLQRIFEDFDADMKEKDQEEQSSAKKDRYSSGSISLTPLRILYQKRVPSSGNRLLRMQEFNGEDMFLLVHVREEDNVALKDFDSSIKCRLKSKMLNGIDIMGRTYRLFGASSSQLRDMSFWFIANNNRSIEEAWKLLGDFSAIKNVANCIARIGLYLTTSRETEVNKFVLSILVENTSCCHVFIDFISI